MTQPTPTSVPDHGTGWGLLLLFAALYGVVALLGVGTVAAAALHYADRPLPAALEYLVTVVFLGALGVAGFALLVAATAGMYDVVALLALVAGLPPALVVGRRRGSGSPLVARLAHAAMTWSLPFLLGFAVVAFAGTAGGGVPPAVTGALAVLVAVGGTVLVDRSSVLPDPAGSVD